MEAARLGSTSKTHICKADLLHMEAKPICIVPIASANKARFENLLWDHSTSSLPPHGEFVRHNNFSAVLWYPMMPGTCQTSCGNFMSREYSDPRQYEQVKQLRNDMSDHWHGLPVRRSQGGLAFPTAEAFASIHLSRMTDQLSDL